jgi:serine protease Do
MSSFILPSRPAKIALAGCALVASLAPCLSRAGEVTRVALQPTNAADSPSDARTLSRSFHNAAQRVLPAVVMIENRPRATDEQSDPSPQVPPGLRGTPFERFFSDPQLQPFFQAPPSPPQGERVGIGSGVVIDPTGLILTNNHVVEGGGLVTVRLSDGREFQATQVKTDPKTDLAIVKIDATGLDAAQLGDSDQIEVGDWVLALGQPFGLEGTVTAGIISAKHRGIGITDRENFLQTDAAINPGNSGGPLVDLDGRVVGINTAISSRSGGNDGVGFAVPINLAKWVGHQLVTTGVVRRAYLGVALQPVSQDLAEQFGVQTRQGVVVVNVFPDSPAARAGLQAGDVITRFAGQPISNALELQGFVEAVEPAAQQQLEVIRDGKAISLTVVCQEQPSDFGQVQRGDSPRQESPAQPQFNRLGLQATTLSNDVAQELGLHQIQGVVITAILPNGPAAEAGLQPGMVISQVSHRPISSLDEFTTAVNQTDARESILLLVHSRQGSRFVVLHPAHPS